MTVRYHNHATLAAAEAHCATLRAACVLCHIVTLNAHEHQVVERYARDAAPSAVDAYIGTLAAATLEPITDKPAGSDSRVILDARNVDHWGRTHGR